VIIFPFLSKVFYFFHLMFLIISLFITLVHFIVHVLPNFIISGIHFFAIVIYFCIASLSFFLSFSWTIYGPFSYLSPPFILCPCPFVLSISLFFCSPSFLLYSFLLSRDVISFMHFHFLAAHIS